MGYSALMVGRGWRALLLSFIVLLIAARPVFWTTHPPNYDYVNFALGVEHFSPRDHQPQPPGYPLVVLTARTFHALGLSEMPSLQWTAFLGTILAVWGAFALAEKILPQSGLFAALLLAAHPIVWLSAVISPTRIYVAAGVCWLLIGCLRMAEGDRRALWITAVLLAVFAGFRPEFLVFFAVPYLWSARLGGIPWGRALLGVSVCLALCAPWIVWVIRDFGTVYRTAYVFFHYYYAHSTTTSLFLGAPAQAWQRMFINFLCWNSIAFALFIPALLMARFSIPARVWILCATYFLPALAVQLVVHGDWPDHAIGTVAVLCVLAGVLMSAASARRLLLIGSAALLFMTLAPADLAQKWPSQLRILSLPVFAHEQRGQADLIQQISAEAHDGDAILVLNDAPISWRLVAWEFPKNHVLNLDATLTASSKEAPTGWQFVARKLFPIPERGVLLQNVHHLLFLSAKETECPQREFVIQQLCGSFRCQAGSWIVSVDIGAERSPIVLSPYSFQLQWYDVIRRYP